MKTTHSSLLTDKPRTSRHDRGGVKAAKPSGFTDEQLNSLKEYLRGELRDELKVEIKEELKAEIVEELKPKNLRNLTPTEAHELYTKWSRGDYSFQPYPGINKTSGDAWTPKYWLEEWVQKNLSEFTSREQAIKAVQDKARQDYYCPATWTMFLLAIDIASGATEPKKVSVHQE